eukprot:244771-Chlamydomonas_euryale.AAC.2
MHPLSIPPAPPSAPIVHTPCPHFRTHAQIPHDAYKMDFVFSDVPEGDGRYDTYGGFDYHLPVSGSAVKEPSLYVVHIAVEMAPIAKVWAAGSVWMGATGLGGVVGGHLPVAGRPPSSPAWTSYTFRWRWNSPGVGGARLGRGG